MSFEDDLRRQLQAKAGNLRVAPKPEDLAARIRSRERRAERHERLALGAAVVVLAASLGGLAGAFAQKTQAKPNNSLSTRFQPGASAKTPKLSGRATSAAERAAPQVPSVRTVIDRQLPGGLSLTATVQPFAFPVAISGEWSASAECATGEIVTTTVGQSGSFGGGTSVAQLPTLGPDGLEILSSGVLQSSDTGQVWWVTTAVGKAVTRVAAESVGGTPVTVVPSGGVAVIAGPVSPSSASTGEMSAVAEGIDADESLEFSLGSDPKAIGTASAVPEKSGCSALTLPYQPSSASSSQPAEPSLAAGAIIAAFVQADSANPLLGFAANLAAVNDGGRLSSAAPDSKPASPVKAGAPAPVSALPVFGNGSVDVQQVSFVSASLALVVYRASSGVLLTGEAQLGPSGIWSVTLATFCGNLRAGIVQGDVPPAVVLGCQDQK
jgi:hypothetical protein